MTKHQSKVEVLSDDDDEEDTGNQMSFEDEKKKSLAILEQITTSQSSTSKSKVNAIRSDANQTEHHTNGDTQSKDATFPNHTKRTYELDQTKLKSVFDKTAKSTNTSTETGQFQFQFFNNAERIILPVPKISSVPSRPMSNGTSRTFVSESNNALDGEEDYRRSALPTQVKTNDQPINGTFFFFDIDDRLKEGLEHFVRTEDLNELDRTWPSKRKEIGEALRAKHRKAIQRKDKHRVFNHRRQQKQQHSTSNLISKSEIE